MRYIPKGPQLPLKNPDIFLWHYTSVEVFWKLLNGEFYATHYRYLNDSAEIIYGINTCKECFQNPKNYLPYADNIVKAVEQKDFFLFCFSAESDSLYQWRAYTPQGGFSIGFSYNKLVELLKNYEYKKEDTIYFEFDLQCCKYTSQELIKRYIEFLAYKVENNNIYADCGLTFENDNNSDSNIRFDGNFPEQINENIRHVLQSNPKYQQDVFNSLFLLKMLQMRCATFKNPSFHFEKEYRLVVTGEKLRSLIELIGNKPRIKIKLTNLSKCIERVYVSPHGDVQQNVLFAEIAREKFNLNFEVCTSKSSFNGKY